MENYYLIHQCEKNKFRVYLNFNNSELVKKFTEINRTSVLTNKFVLVIEAVKNNEANRTQFNWEGKCSYGDIYAIKVNEHRFYTIVSFNSGFRELLISRYGKKESEKNDKSLMAIIDSISKIEIKKLLEK